MKFYCVSDIHGFYSEMRHALNEAGFDFQNPEHCLISLGDAIDRGPSPREVIEYLCSLPQKILLWGNHEHLMEEAIERRFFMSHDVHNGTAFTAYDFSLKVNASCMNHAQILGELRDDKLYQKYIGSLVNYHETKHYVFCHGYIPCNSNAPNPYYIQGATYTKRDDWRDATDKEWYDATWINGMKACEVDGVKEDGKTIIVGHYHTSWGHANIEHKCSEFEEDADFSPYYGNGVIAIDACTAYTNKVNVIVIEDELIDD